MDKTLRTFFDYLKCCLNGTPCNLPIEEEKKFYFQARAQGLSGSIFTYLKTTNLSSKVFNAFRRDFQLYTHHDILQRSIIEEIRQLFDNAFIDHVFLKGSKLKSLYPKSYMRTMGDIDLLIKEDAMDKVHKTLLDAGYELKHQSKQHDVFIHPNRTMIEVHPGLYKHVNDKYDGFFNNPWAHVHNIGGYSYSLDSEFEIVYLLYHIVKHFYGTGVGFRFFLDIALYLEVHKQSIDKEKLKGMLDSTSLFTFFKTVLVLNCVYLDYDPYPFWRQNHHLDKSSIEQITELIAASGIHSSAVNANPFDSQVAAHYLANTSKTKLFMQKAFPSMEAMIGRYSNLRKFPFLLPIYWVRRILSKIILQRKTSFKKIQQFTRAGECATSTKKLFATIGL
jgi:hypothetical protein